MSAARTFRPGGASVGESAIMRTGPEALAELQAALQRDGISLLCRLELEERRRQLESGLHVAAMEFARLLTSLGDADGAFEWLEQAFLRREPELLEIGTDPAYDAIRNDPRFAGLTQRIGLPTPKL